MNLIENLNTNIKLPYTFPSKCNLLKINMINFLDTEEVASSNLVDPTKEIDTIRFILQLSNTHKFSSFI